MNQEAMCATLPDRFWSKVEKRGDGCWQWTGAKAHGYGRFWAGAPCSKLVGAHRAAYQALVGVVPEGMDLDHLCRNRACVNPDHLEPVTRRVNLDRGDTQWAVSARTGRCRRGHPLEGENVRVETNGDREYQRCLACRRITNAAKYQRARFSG